MAQTSALNSSQPTTLSPTRRILGNHPVCCFIQQQRHSQPTTLSPTRPEGAEADSTGQRPVYKTNTSKRPVWAKDVSPGQHPGEAEYMINSQAGFFRTLKKSNALSRLRQGITYITGKKFCF